MTVHFIGAGPGSPDLITIRGLNWIKSCPVCLYAGSLVPYEILLEAPKTAKIINTFNMNLSDIIEEIKHANKLGKDVSRVHSGDLSIYSTIAEQMRQLDFLKIPYDVTPGITTFSAAAAVLKKELTLPGISQSIILSRVSKNMPPRENLINLAASRATIILHLSIKNLDMIQKNLIPLYGRKCPIVILSHVSQSHQSITHGVLESIDKDFKKTNVNRTAIIFIGEVLKNHNFSNSYIYSNCKSSL